MKHIGEKFLSVIMLLLAAMAFAPQAQAITAEEMDHARAIAAKLYLRWANNGSDYLDPLDPKSLAELEGKLKEKEKENIKAFKSVSTPADYAKWDKEKAVEYWSVTFFKASGLSEDGRRARASVKKKLQAMSFSAPSEETKAAPAAAAAANEATPELPSAAPAPEETPAAPAEAAPAELPSAEEIVAQTETTDSLAGVIEDTATEQQKKSGSNSWMYIVALVVLVGIVVWLVIFASRTMQNSAKAARDLDKDDEPAPIARLSGKSERTATPAAAAVEETPTQRAPKVRQQPVVAEEDAEESESILRDRYARRLAAKDTEIHELQRQVRDLRDENLRLADENSRLNSDLSMARREMEALKSRAVAAGAASAHHHAGREQVPVRETNPVHAPAASVEARHHDDSAERAVAAPAGGANRDIYLGRVNAKGIFVRADRKPIEGKSVFVLSTSDSYTGTFRVIQSASTIDMALENPEYYLGGGCVATDLFDTQDAEGIRTVGSGTAIFEDGCWRVLRKAKIAYE